MKMTGKMKVTIILLVDKCDVDYICRDIYSWYYSHRIGMHSISIIQKEE